VTSTTAGTAAAILALFVSRNTVLTSLEIVTSAAVPGGEEYKRKTLYELRRAGRLERFLPDPYRADRPAYRLPR
jgi:hypothetical protein